MSHQCCQFLRSFPQARDSVVAPAAQPTRVPTAAANVVTDRYSLQSTYLNVGYRTLLCAHHVEPRQTDPTTHEINRRDHPARLEFLQDDPVDQNAGATPKLMMSANESNSRPNRDSFQTIPLASLVCFAGPNLKSASVTSQNRRSASLSPLKSPLLSGRDVDSEEALRGCNLVREGNGTAGAKGRTSQQSPRRVAKVIFVFNLVRLG